MKFGPVEYVSIDGIKVLGGHTFVRKTAQSLELLRQTPKYMKTCRNIRLIVQSRFCSVATRVSRKHVIFRVLHLDFASTKVSTLSLASFLVNEAKRIEIEFQWSFMARLTYRGFRRSRIELEEELACLENQIDYLNETCPESPLIPSLRTSYLLIRGNKFMPGICNWLERNC